MASLLVADELSEVYTELDGLRDDQRGRTPPPAASDLDRLAQRIEKIAERLETS